MGDDKERKASKHKRSHEKDPERKSKKRHKHGDEGGSSSKKRSKRDRSDKLHITDDDPNDEDMWVEKNIDMDGERVSILIVTLICILLIMHSPSLWQQTSRQLKV